MYYSWYYCQFRSDGSTFLVKLNVKSAAQVTDIIAQNMTDVQRSVFVSFNQDPVQH